jgi:site-specific DNA-cytosine methylase
MPAIAFQPRFARNDRGAPQNELAYPLTAEAGRTGKGDSAQCVVHGWAVRRLTPVECARLQGFPDHHSRIPWRGRAEDECPDGPQYKTYGNSMAVKCMRWLGGRFEAVNAAARDAK